jgi:transcriptional regulator with AAA-type ATPase domain
MSPLKTLIAWLSVQDCRSIKDYPATQGGVVLSALNSTGATRLLLLSHLQSQFTNEYLEKLSQSWAGDIELRMVDEGVSTAIGDLWPWASEQLKTELDAHPGMSHELLLASSVPACQAIFLTHGLTDERCHLLEPRKNGDFQALTLPRVQVDSPLVSQADQSGDAPLEQAHAMATSGTDEVDFYDLGFDETPATDSQTDMGQSDADASAGPGLLAVLADVEETCDEVATENEFGVSNAGQIDWFDESIEAPAELGLTRKSEPILAPAPIEEVWAEQALETEPIAETASEPADLSEDDAPAELASEWAVEEVALKPAEEIDFSGVVIDETETAFEPESNPVGEPELESAHEWAVEEVALKPAEEIDFPEVDIEPPESFMPAEAQDAAFEVDIEPAAEISLEDELSKAAAALDDPFDDFASVGAADLESQAESAPEGLLASASDLDLDFPETSTGEDAPGALQPPLLDPLSQALAEADAIDPPAPVAAPWPYASSALQQLSRRADALAGGELPVLVLGEAGSGTRLLAKRIHESGGRCNAPMIVADLSAIHPDAMSQELWGEDASVRGERRAGFVELAQGGSLLIAGLELMPVSVQTQLLSLMTRGDYLAVGAENPTPADVRMLATASDELLSETKAGRFNRKLFDLFGKGLLTIPALRNRKADLPALLNAMWQFIQSEESHQRTLSDDARDWLLFHGFSGTVKDLELALRRGCLWAQGDEVDVDTLRESVALGSIPQAVAHCGQAIADGFSLKDVVFSVTKHFIHQALTQSQYDLDKAAALLGVSDREALAGWMKRVGIEMPNENNFEDTHAEHHDFETAYVASNNAPTGLQAQSETFDPDVEISLS